MIDDVKDTVGVDRPARLFRFPYGERDGSRSASFQASLDELGFKGAGHDRYTSDSFQADIAGGTDWF